MHQVRWYELSISCDDMNLHSLETNLHYKNLIRCFSNPQPHKHGERSRWKRRLYCHTDGFLTANLMILQPCIQQPRKPNRHAKLTARDLALVTRQQPRLGGCSTRNFLCYFLGKSQGDHQIPYRPKTTIISVSITACQSKMGS